MRTEDSREIGRTDNGRRAKAERAGLMRGREDLLRRMADGFGAVDRARTQRQDTAVLGDITNEANVRQTFVADGQTFDEEKDASGLADGRIYDEGHFWSSPKIRARN